MDLALTKPNGAPENRLLSICPKISSHREGAYKQALNASWDWEVYRPSFFSVALSTPNALTGPAIRSVKSTDIRLLGGPSHRLAFGLAPLSRCSHPRMPPIRGGKNRITNTERGRATPRRRSTFWIRRSFFLYCESVVVRGARGDTGVYCTAGAHLPLVHFAARGTSWRPGRRACRATRFRLLWVCRDLSNFLLHLSLRRNIRVVIMGLTGSIALVCYVAYVSQYQLLVCSRICSADSYLHFKSSETKMWLARAVFSPLRF
ncbi:hypothetical protein DFH06DRAFT_72424 [Mycena polygramma]|nr:hypothetical protein DFH06DRAFT_72424 [Mycena polygramma]